MKPVCITHAIYILITAIWPILDIQSFMVVTGSKTDIWLVKTVGALLIPLALTMLLLLSSHARTQLIFLGASTAVAFIVIDTYYALNNVISNIYLLDAIVELIFLIAWISVAFTKKKEVVEPLSFLKKPPREV